MYVNFLFFIFIFCYKSIFYRAETPPNTPQRARIAAQQLERLNRTLDSPQRHRIPHLANPPLIPLNYNAPPPLDLPVVIPGDDPFALPPGPPVVVPGDDPLALPAPAREAVHFNGHQYHYLPQNLAAALRNVPREPPAPPRGRRCGQIPPVSSLFSQLSQSK